MNSGAWWSLMLWAAHDLGRRPGSALLTGGVIALVVTFLATTLLLIEAWTATTTSLIEAGPSLVVRRVTPTGWAPMPLDASLESARSVTGVTAVEPRIWGLASSVDGPLTVVGVTPPLMTELEVLGYSAPGKGEALVGSGVPISSLDMSITLVGVADVTLQVSGVLPSDVALAAHDLVFLNEIDARLVLGLSAHEASDLAVSVYHEAEGTAVRPDLNAAFRFPVNITDRRDAIGAVVGTLTRDGGLATMLLVPALLAMALLVANAWRDVGGSRRDIGLFKTFGWSTGDLVRVQLIQSLAVAVPATMTGLAIAWMLVFRPGVTWPGALLLGWRTPPPPLTLTTDGAALVVATVVGLVIGPWLLATLVPAIRSALADPDDLVRGGR